MQRKRSGAVGPLSIVLPRPTLNRPSSSFHTASTRPSSPYTPHTPRNIVSPTASCIFIQSNRKSSDSWTSSIDEREFDWFPDQILLLSRTLDALPSHLLTPFNGSVPPSGLLDKIARGIAEAKGVDWPHSLRATRLKLLEISRAHASNAHSIPEESCNGNNQDCLADSTNLPSKSASRRPLYRQSSMDFLDNVKQPDRIDRLSSRLQRADRMIAPISPYITRSVSKRSSVRSSSPARPNSLVAGPSTASSSTLASLTSAPPTAFRPRRLRRSASVLSSTSSTACSTSTDRMSVDSVQSLIAAAISSTESLVKPTRQKTSRTKRSESFAAPTSHSGVKRAPSYGTLAQESRAQGKTRAASPCSSDEEEKIRTRVAVKKARTKTSMDVKGGKPVLQPSHKIILGGSTAEKKGSPHQKKTPVLDGDRSKRNPSMFGPELPQPPTPPSASALIGSPMIESPQQPPRTLRRVKRLPTSSLAKGESLGRKISFGALQDSTMESPPSECPGLARLGSAFTLS